MIQNKKDLLLKDLCARLPYGVKGRVSRSDNNNRKCEFVAIIDGKLYDRFAVFQESWYDNVTIKPYLFPLSSMTEEQKDEYVSLQQRVIYNSRGLVNLDVMEYTAWCYKHHIDINGLIPMGLAIDATGLNIY